MNPKKARNTIAAALLLSREHRTNEEVTLSDVLAVRSDLDDQLSMKATEELARDFADGKYTVISAELLREIIATLQSAHHDADYLSPEEFDDEEHEQNFQDARESERELLEKLETIEQELP